MSQLLDNILSRSNMLEDYNQVRANKGSARIDGVTIDEIDDYLRQNWRPTKKLIMQRKYPQPVLRVEIPKTNGGVRQFGIPTVIDRMIQQAIVQVISPICEPHFSETSYGFKPEIKLPDALIIPISVMFRFFYKVKEDYQQVTEAMYLHGLVGRQFFRQPLRMIEYCFVPLLLCLSRTADDVAISTTTRGMVVEQKRSMISNTKLRTLDYVLILAISDVSSISVKFLESICLK